MSVAALIEHCGNELTEGRFIQTTNKITEDRAHFVLVGDPWLCGC